MVKQTCKTIFGLFFIVLGLLLPQVVFAQDLLFSLPYGDGDGQVSMYIPSPNVKEHSGATGPGWFSADGSLNDVFIDLQKFNMKGEFISKVTPPDNQLLKGMKTCSWIDAEENVYAIVPHPTGHYDQIIKLNKDGVLMWIKSLPDLFAQDKRYEGVNAEGINVDAQGNVYFEVYYRANAQDKTAGIKCFKLDQNGSLLGEVPSCHLDKNGNYYVFSPIYSKGNLFGTVMFGEKYVGDYTSGADVQIIDSGNKLARKVKISLPYEFTHYSNYRDVYDWGVDLEGNIYATAAVIRDRTQRMKLIDNVLVIPDDYYIYKFDQEGKLVFQTNFPGYPIGLGKTIQVDTYQNVYYLQFYADHLDVMKVKTDTISPEVDIAIKPERLDNDKDKGNEHDKMGKTDQDNKGHDKDKDDKNQHKDKDKWYMGAVQAILTAKDNEWGSGVKELHYLLTGAVSAEEVLATTEATITISEEGTTVIKAFAVDNAENIGSSETAVIRIRGE